MTRNSVLSKEEVQAKECGEVYTLQEFIELIEGRVISSNDGFGYFHNSKELTDIDVFDYRLKWNDIKDYPYVCWYNK